ncbi:hypothetical protein AWV80_23400 [Cupriavidus sp. UYMU48A]|nr:hypothetical protein AWV80_23400 [Cupriavidus sp. UYMU48A]
MEFHPDLQKDLNELSNVKVRPYLSVSAFVDKEVDKEEHLIDHAKAYPIFENYLEEQALAYFDSADPSYLEELGRVVLPGTDVLNYVTGVSSEFMEGVEDMSVDVTNDLGSENIYVSCTHDLRIVVFYISIPESAYAANKVAVAASGHIYEVEEQGRTVVLKLTARAYLTASFIYNGVNEECSGYSSSIIGFR